MSATTFKISISPARSWSAVLITKSSQEYHRSPEPCGNTPLPFPRRTLVAPASCAHCSTRRHEQGIGQQAVVLLSREPLNMFLRQTRGFPVEYQGYTMTSYMSRCISGRVGSSIPRVLWARSERLRWSLNEGLSDMRPVHLERVSLLEKRSVFASKGWR